MTELWKAWENDEAVFPPFPQSLEIAAAITTFPPPRLLRAVNTPEKGTQRRSALRGEKEVTTTIGNYGCR